MATSTDGFVKNLKVQIGYLKDGEYGYDSLSIYVVGIKEPWEFGPEDDFDFPDGDNVMIIREGPTEEDDEDDFENEGVPEHIFPLQHIVASELASSGE